MKYHPTRITPTLQLLALFGAISLFFSTIEFLIPKPVPYMRLGLANIPVLISLRLFKTKYFFYVVLLKVIAQAILNGTVASYIVIFSLLGSLTSACVMLLVNQLCKHRVSLVGISVAGGCSSALAQGGASLIFIFGMQSLVVLFPLVSIGLVSGTIIGILTEYFFRTSKFLSVIRVEHIGS